MVTIDVQLEQLDTLDPQVPVVVPVPEAEVHHRAPHDAADVRNLSARLDLARRWSSLGERAPRLLESLRAAS